jgi:hypothetical protein
MKPAQDNLHAELRDRMRESPLLLQEAVITALETFSEYHYPQIGPYYNPIVHVGIDVSIDLNLHCRTILQDCNRAALAKLLIVLNAVAGAVCIRFIYGDFPDDCTIAQWNFSRNSWTFHKPRGEQ